jgi:glyoxylase-like metal-dependent hydrolase (beta-lactamase superfamily II)
MTPHTEAEAEVEAEAASVRAADKPEVATIRLSVSNAYLIRGPRPVLVDTGSKTDLAALRRGLAVHGLKPADLALIVLTHGHADHAGLAAELRRQSGAPVVIGRGDAPMAAAGHNDELRPTSRFAALARHFAFDPAYEPLRADLEVGDAPLDLALWTLQGALHPMPGHTAGSLVLLLDDGRAFAGDLLMGGWLGGALFARRASLPYFVADRAAHRASLRALLALPVHTLYLGHGGPLSRAAVIEAFGAEIATA